MKSYKIGIDTGGTYTDAVVFEPGGKKVLKSVKALTSHGRLELGIVSALKELFQDKKAVYRVSDPFYNPRHQQPGGKERNGPRCGAHRFQ